MGIRERAQLSGWKWVSVGVGVLQEAWWWAGHVGGREVWGGRRATGGRAALTLESPRRTGRWS